MQQAIGAAGRHEINFIEIVFRQFDTIGHQLGALGIMSAATALAIKQIANNIGEDNFIRVFILQFNQTAFGAAIAQRFPLRVVHLGQWHGLPKRFLCHLPLPLSASLKLTRTILSASLS
jgi:hypothetical protein